MQIEGEKVEAVTDFIFLGSKITVAGNFSHEIKTLASWKKSYDKPRQRIKKQRHLFANKSSYSQSYGFPVIIYGCDSWIIRKADCQRIYALELWRWRRLLKVP